MRLRSAILAALVGASLTIITPTPASAAAPCVGTWTIGIGGLGDNQSRVFAPYVHQRVGYQSYVTRSGVDELNRLIRTHRAQCPGDHIKAIGYSGGAAALHIWVTENYLPNLNAILLSDPKRPAGPGGPGFAALEAWLVGYPLAGVDAYYGATPVLSVCYHADHICSSDASWNGYLFEGAHGNYNFDVHSYGNWESGTRYY